MSRKHETSASDRLLDAENQRVLIVATDVSTPHLETSLEIALRLARDEHDVHFLFLVAPYLEFVPLAYSTRQVVKRVENAVRLARSGAKGAFRSDIVHLAQEHPEVDRDTFRSTIEWVANFDLEDSVRSSAMTRFGSCSFGDPSFSAELQTMRWSGALVYDHLVRELTQTDTDLVVFFNGRFVNSRAVWRAAEICGVAWASHERGGQDDRFYFEVGATVHDQCHLASRASERLAGPNGPAEPTFSVVDVTEELRLAAEALVGSDVVRGDGSAPTLDVVYFASSFNEYGAAGYPLFEPWGSEQAAFTDLFEQCAALGLSVGLRLHPNMQNFVGELERWDDTIQSLPAVRTFLPADPTSSYELLERCRVVATGFSTVGLEAALRAKPLIGLSDSGYVSIVGGRRCGSGADIREALRSATPTSPEAAARYVQFTRAYGWRYELYRPFGSNEGAFLGRSLNHLEATEKRRKRLRKRAKWVRGVIDAALNRAAGDGVSPSESAGSVTSTLR